MTPKGHHGDTSISKTQHNSVHTSNFVLDKSIFSNIFEKDIKRVYIYKKAERLAKAIHLITPAFRNSPALSNRLDAIAVGLVDAATLPVTKAKEELSRELLTLSSVLAIARTGGLLSEMNAELISHEAHLLLQEVAAYESPRLFLDDAPSLAELAKGASVASREPRIEQVTNIRKPLPHESGSTFTLPERTTAKTESHEAHKDNKQGTPYKGQTVSPIKDRPATSSRREAVLSVLKAKGSLSIKDLSTVIRDVSEKTIQRELQALIQEGVIEKSGERRWTVYSLAS
jgi:DNA-binding transcriptional ArsR family regulator